MLLRMTRWLVMIVLCLLPSLVVAQYPVTQLTSVYPFGGKLGSTFEVTITGTDLDDAEQLVFSHPGITAKPKPAQRTFDVTINPMSHAVTTKFACADCMACQIHVCLSWIV